MNLLALLVNVKIKITFKFITSNTLTFRGKLKQETIRVDFL